MKLVYSTAFLLAAVNGQRITVPATPKAGIAAIMEDAFPTHLANLKKHGCWCSYAHVDNTDSIGGVKPVDYLDDLCRRWFSSRRCTVLKDGDCRNDHDDSYQLITLPWYSCSHKQNNKKCDKSTCTIDVHFKDLIEEYINDLVASDGSFKATTPADGECIRVFPIERPAAPHVTPSTFYCTGEAPDVKRTDYYDDTFDATVGAFTQLQAQLDQVRAVASDEPVFIDFSFKPSADVDQWTVWKVDVSGDIEKVETYANTSSADVSGWVTHPWLITKGEDTIFDSFLCGYAAAPGKTTVSFTVVGDTCIAN